ncbi:MAG: hypothetical protein Wins2KO_32470 [Winogradskyella sp.]
MKKLILVLTMIFAVTFTATAQNEMTTTEKYDKYFEAKAEMDFRNYILEALDLNSDEIKAIDPLLRDYLNERVDLSENKINLVEDYQEEMKEDDRVADEREETSDFIEEYWEASIAEIELKKNYFDRFEDVIAYEKALAFFMLEDEVQYQILKKSLIQVQPWILKFDTYFSDYNNRNNNESMGYNSKDSDQKNWSNDKSKDAMTKKNWSKSAKDKDSYSYNKTNKKGSAVYNTFTSWVEDTNNRVGVKHKYTSNGLKALSNVFTQMNDDGFFADDRMVNNKTERLNIIAEKLQEDWKSTMHADWTREAFMITAELFEAAQSNKNFSSTSNAVSTLSVAARDIDPKTLMTDQAPDIYDFFEQTKVTINTFTKAAMKEHSMDTSKRK